MYICCTRDVHPKHEQRNSCKGREGNFWKTNEVLISRFQLNIQKRDNFVLVIDISRVTHSILVQYLNTSLEINPQRQFFMGYDNVEESEMRMLMVRIHLAFLVHWGPYTPLLGHRHSTLLFIFFEQSLYDTLGMLNALKFKHSGHWTHTPLNMRVSTLSRFRLMHSTLLSMSQSLRHFLGARLVYPSA